MKLADFSSISNYERKLYRNIYPFFFANITMKCDLNITSFLISLREKTITCGQFSTPSANYMDVATSKMILKLRNDLIKLICLLVKE